MDTSGIKVLSFDCYGTLIDWETGIWTALQPLVQRAHVKPAREEALAAFAMVEPDIEHEHPHLPYREILVRVHTQLAARWGASPDPEGDRRFGASVGEWPAFPDTVDALARLARHFRLVVLSNVDRQSFAATTLRLGINFDAICTAEEIGSYKPDLRNFRHLVDRVANMGYARDQLMHVAQSLYHDIAPAEAIGLRRCWINRRQDKATGSGATRPLSQQPSFDATFPSLAAFAEACAAR